MVKLPSGLEVSANIALADPELNSLTVAELYEKAKEEEGPIVIYSETSKMAKAAAKFMAEYPELKVDWRWACWSFLHLSLESTDSSLCCLSSLSLCRWR